MARIKRTSLITGGERGAAYRILVRQSQARLAATEAATEAVVTRTTTRGGGKAAAAAAAAAAATAASTVNSPFVTRATT